MSLRQKFSLVFVLVTIIPLFLASIVTFNETETAMKRVLFDKNRVVAESMAGKVEFLFNERFKLLKLLAGNDEVISMNINKIQSVLRGVEKQYPDLGIAFVIGLDGNLLARSDGGDLNINYMDRPYFVQALETRKITFSGVVLSKTKNVYVVVVAHPIIDSNGAIAGVIAVSVEVDKILDLMNNHVSAVENAYAFIVDNEGKLLVHPDRKLMDARLDVSALEAVRGVLENQTGWAEYVFNGQAKLAGYSRIGLTGWGLVYQQPLKGVMATVNKLRITNSLIMSVAGIAAAIIGMYVAKQMIKPLTEMAKAADRLANNEHTESIVVNTGDEIGELANAFNRMTKQIANHAESITRQNAYLSSLHNLSLEINNRLGSESILDDIVKKAAELIGTQHGFLYIFDTFSGNFIRLIGFGVYEKDIGRIVSGSNSVISRVRATGDYVIIKDYSKYEHRLPDPFFDFVGSVLNVPLGSDKEFFGAVGLAFTDKSRMFTTDEIGLLKQFTEMAAIAYKNTKILSDLQAEIAKRIKAEGEVQQHAGFLQNLIDNIPNPVFFKDLNGVYQGANIPFCNCFGIKKEDVIGKTVFDIATIDNAEQHAIMDAELIRCGGSQNYSATISCAYDCSVRDVIFNKAVYNNADGSQRGIIGVIQDVTKLKEKEAEALKYAGELERSNRELEQFAQVCSHDLQEPLRKIMAFGDRLRTHSAGMLNEKSIDYLERMQGAADRMSHLVEDILIYSRVGTKGNPFQKVILEHTMMEAMASLEFRLEDTDGQVVVGKLPEVIADGPQMSQLFQNLIGNALKFHKEGVSPKVTISCNVNRGNETVLVIEDNGIGFDEKYLDKIFVPFQRLHGRNEFEGTGMGLAICKKIVDIRSETSAIGTLQLGSYVLRRSGS